MRICTFVGLKAAIRGKGKDDVREEQNDQGGSSKTKWEKVRDDCIDITTLVPCSVSYRTYGDDGTCSAVSSWTTIH